MPDDFKLRLKEVGALLPEFTAQATAGSLQLETVAAIRDAWGNPFSPPPDFIIEGCRTALRAKLGILECGSGLTTVLLTVVAAVRKLPYASLEHDGTWCEVARKAMTFLGLPISSIAFAPLKNYGDFDWYDVGAVNVPATFDFILCDGPPGVTRGGRFGLFPVMQSYISPECVVLLDDVDREGEQTALNRWKNEFEISFELQGSFPRRFAVARRNS